MKVGVVVVGGGPSGLIAAAEAARHGIDVLVLEEHREIGVPDHCAGLISLGGLKALGVSESCVKNYVKGARVFSPSGLMMEVSRERAQAAVVNRVRVDKELAMRAERKGVEVRTERRVRELGVGKKHVKVRCKEEEHEAELVIIAEGAPSAITRSLGIKPSLTLPAHQCELEVDMGREDVEIYFGNCWSPGFFTWCIPLGDGLARLGLACRLSNPRELLRRVASKHPIISRRILRRPLREMAGMVTVGGPLRGHAFGRLIIIGDAGGFAKPTTGGGLVYGGLTAKLAGGAVGRALLLNDVNYLSLFERGWREKLGVQFRCMRFLANYIQSLTDRELDQLFLTLKKLGIDDDLRLFGDMDLQGDTLRKLVTKAKNIELGFTILVKLFKWHVPKLFQWRMRHGPEGLAAQ